MESMNGTTASIRIPHFACLQNPEGEEAQDVFRKAEQENLEECTKRILKNFYRCGANRKDLNDAGFDKYIQWNGNQNQDDLNRKCGNFIRSATTDPEFNKVMVLYGQPGMGKTFFSLSMIKMLCATKKPDLFFTKERLNANGETVKIQENANVTDFYTGYYVTSEDLCTYSSGKGLVGEAYTRAKAKIDLYKSCKLLVIDELGRAILNSKIERDTVFSIVNHRINNYLPTVLCTNFTEDGIHQTFGEAFYSRIKANGLWFCCDGLENMRAPGVQRYLKERRNGGQQKTNQF